MSDAARCRGGRVGRENARHVCMRLVRSHPFVEGHDDFFCSRGWWPRAGVNDAGYSQRDRLAVILPKCMMAAKDVPGLRQRPTTRRVPSARVRAAESLSRDKRKYAAVVPKALPRDCFQSNRDLQPS